VKVVMLPSLLPFILSGIGMTVPAAFLGAIVGEILGGRSGVGYLIERSAGQFDSAGMMAGVVVVGFMGALATLCIARPAEKYLERMGAR
jgi:NitT/TauT family transport system permease protein